jgi:drug/metabolite transporter (DMT)-like permease
VAGRLPDLSAREPAFRDRPRYQIVLVAFPSYLAWFWLLSRYPASHLHAFTFWTPLFGLLGGRLLLGDPVTPTLVVAMGCVTLGIYLVNRQPGRAGGPGVGGGAR